MEKVENIKKEETIMAIIGIILIVLIIVMSIIASINLHNQEKKNDAIVDGALEDMSLNRSDFKIIELKIFEGTNVFILRLDDRLFLGAYDEREDGIYVDVVKEI